MILRAKGIHALVLFGISTSGAVLSTLLDAFDADYRSSVIADCCADTAPEFHEVLVKHMFPARGEVIGAGIFVEALGTNPPGWSISGAHMTSPPEARKSTFAASARNRGELSSQMTTGFSQ
jgi:hypothetical protein